MFPSSWLETNSESTIIRLLAMVASVSVCSSSLIADDPADLPSLTPNPLSRPAEDALIQLAGQSDVQILGELHGTKEVPAVAAALLQPLSQQGYGVLALELPRDEQQPLTDWVTGTTDVVPRFFAEPGGHGRASAEVLSLIRTALSRPYSWRLICFDETWERSVAESRAFHANASPSIQESVAFFVDRDNRMATTFTKAKKHLGGQSKTLVICGGMHARTANPPSAVVAGREFVARHWPCFASLLIKNHPQWTVRSVDVVPCSGQHFAAYDVDADGEPIGKAHRLGKGPDIEAAEFKKLETGFWDGELYLPRVSPATFLAPPYAAPTSAR